LRGTDRRAGFVTACEWHCRRLFASGWIVNFAKSAACPLDPSTVDKMMQGFHARLPLMQVVDAISVVSVVPEKR
jgi:hypothetical protein